MKVTIVLIALCLFIGAFAEKRNYEDDDSDVRVVPNLAVENVLTVGNGNKQVQISNGGIQIGGVPFTGPTGASGAKGNRGGRGPRGHNGSPVGTVHSVSPTFNRAGASLPYDSDASPVVGDVVTFTSSDDLIVGQIIVVDGGSFYQIQTAGDHTYTAQFVGTGVTGAVGAGLAAGTNFVTAGQQGQAGAQGPQGAAGAVGPQGPLGPQGVTGPQGVQGVTGPQGPQGQKGGRGGRGRRGKDGFKGDPGQQGPVGPVGAKGDKGAVGPQGPAGPAGLLGEAGIAGPQGAKGRRGRRGKEGDKGDQGVAGPQGPQGIEGPVGPLGPAGPQGPQGPKGDPFVFQSYTDIYSYFLPSISSNSSHYGDFTYYASQDTSLNFNIFSNLYTKLGSNPVSPPQNNRNLNSLSVESYSKSCPANTVLVDGACSWNLFTYEKSPSWCRASDFVPGPPGCVNCVVRVDKVKNRYFDGNRNVPVVRRLTVSDSTGKIESVALNGRSCKIVNLFELSDQEVSSCGFFCFFHDIETIHLQENTVTCRYIPPQNIASALQLTVADTATGFDGKVSVVTVQVACQTL